MNPPSTVLSATNFGWADQLSEHGHRRENLAHRTIGKEAALGSGLVD